MEKMSALTSGKIDENKYLTGEEILPSNQRQIIEQAKFVYSLWKKQKRSKTKGKNKLKLWKF